MPEGFQVNEMFSAIADGYDGANHFLSGGMDYYWRRRLVGLIKQSGVRKVLDLATGSGDVAFALKKAMGDGIEVIGMDFCQSMLRVAEEKKVLRPYGRDIRFELGDCLNLPLEDCCVDGITIAFGFRNLQDRVRGLAEMKRVLKPGGKLFILEFTQPYAWFCPVYYFYLRRVLPKLARFFTERVEAYVYLAESIKDFPDRDRLSEEIGEAGFRDVRSFPMTLSTVAVHLGVS